MRVLLAVWLWALAVTISPAAPAPPQAGPGPAAMPLDVLSYDLAANQDTPELCFHLSQTVMRQPGMPLESFVAAEPAVKLIARPRNTALCVTGFDFGVTYAVTLKAGLPGVAGALAKDTQIHVQVPHRPPELGFAAPDADLLPRLGSEGLPVRSVNTPAISIAIFRISDRDMLLQPRATLTGDLAAAFAPTRGERIWQGTVETKGEPDKDAVTYLQPDKVLGPLKPGVYVAVAWPSGFPAIPGPRPLPTQYFTVCDFGLTAYRAAANMLVAVRSLSTAAAVSGIDVALVAVDNRELARVRTDESGFARFDGALLSGRGDDRPAALYAYGGAGELSALPIAATSVGMVQIRSNLRTDRGVYRPGDTVTLAAFPRDLGGMAVGKQPLVIDVYRPNGALFDTLTLEDRGAGGYQTRFVLPRSATLGRWRMAVRGDQDFDATLQFDVLAPRVEHLVASVDADAAVIDPAQPGAVTVDTRYADGEAAGGTPGEFRVGIQPADNPFPAFPGFAFGLDDERDPAVTLDPVRFTTDVAGKAAMPLKFGTLPDASRPLDARIAARVLDAAGRPIPAETEVPIATRNLFFGIRPSSAGSFPEGQAAHFEIVALSRDGARQERRGTGWEVVRRDFNPAWTWDGASFAYRPSVKDTHVAGGTVDVSADLPGTIDVSLPAGRYRLEAFDPKGEAISSVYFSVGWAPSETGEATDSVAVTVAKQKYAPGDGVDVFVKPPFDSDVTLVAADAAVRSAMAQHIGVAGATIHLDTPRDARAGMTLLASAVAPPSGTSASGSASGLPRRAAGIALLPVDPAFRQLDIRMELPEKAVPGQTLTIPVSIAGAGDDPAFVEISAANALPNAEADADGQDSAAPAEENTVTPVAVFDDYGRIITPTGLSAGHADPAREAQPRKSEALTARIGPLVSASSGVVPLDRNGKAAVPLSIPDVGGTLTIRAIAWSATKLGGATAKLPVRPPVAVDLRAPETLAPEDRAELTLALNNVDGPRGEYHVRLHADGAVALADDGELVLNLAEHEQRARPVTIVGKMPGAGGITVEVQGPNAIDFARRVAVEVRATAVPVARHGAVTVKAGAALAIDPALSAGLRPDSIAASLAASPGGSVDLDGIGRELRNPDYPAAERLVDAGTVAPADASLTARRLFDLQGADGGFSQWGNGGSDVFLSAYVVDFLGRARKSGAAIPEAPFQHALDYLAKSGVLDPAPPTNPGTSPPANAIAPGSLEAAAYAGKVLAMNKRLDRFQLRYFADRTLALIHAPVTGALLAAGFAELGDKATAAALFAQAAALNGQAPDGFASELRDDAMLTALMAESGVADPASIQATLARALAAAGQRRQFSPQEAAWLFRAQSAMQPDKAAIALKIGDQTLQEAGSASFAPKPGETALPGIKNQGSAPVRLNLTVTGIPSTPDLKDQSGYEIQRALFDIAGKPLDPMALKQDALAVVVISGRFTGSGEGRPVVIDPLPAGWQMEAPAIVDAGARYPWLKDLSGEAAASYQDGAFTAAPVLAGDRHEFKIAYVVRAAVRGQFAMPGAVIQDMAQPNLAGRTAAGRTRIDEPAP